MNKKIRNDVLLIGFILIIALSVFLILRLNSETGETVKISVNGKEKYSFSLSENTKQIIETEWGKNTVEIKDGSAMVISADCPDKICENHREISMVGETIVCLPHKLVVEICQER